MKMPKYIKNFEINKSDNGLVATFEINRFHPAFIYLVIKTIIKNYFKR